MQALYREPDLVFAILTVEIDVDARTPLNVVLVQGKQLVLRNSRGWGGAKLGRLLGELDEREQTVLF